MIPFDMTCGWRSEVLNGTTYHVRDVAPMVRLCVVFLERAFQFSQLLDHDGFVLIQNGPKRPGLQLHTTIVTLTPEQAMQNADRWWDVASKLPRYNAEPLEPSNA